MNHFTLLKHKLSKQFEKIKLGAIVLVLFPSLGYADGITDKFSPKINLYSPSTHFEVMRGENIHIDAILQDDKELESYSIEITKGGIESDRYADAFSSYQKKDANGNELPSVTGKKSIVLNIYIKVSEKAIVGDYNLLLVLKDTDGNKQVVERNFYVIRN